jgi:hypothetical protein
MAELTKADLVWNRACETEIHHKFAGDQALAAMILFDSLTANGGVLHAIECLEPDGTLSASIKGYQFFGLEAVAAFIEEASSTHYPDDADMDFLEPELDQRYWALVPDDILRACFKRVFEQSPSLFAALT